MSQASDNNLGPLIEGRDILVSVGCGGVGKTTTAAAVALHCALEGGRSLALTIDPAHRLADSLGMPDIGGVEKEIDLSGLDNRRKKSDEGGLWAMMLEAKRTFDNMIVKYAPSPEAAKRIFANPFYQHVSGALSGSQEYMAIEKLSELHAEKRFDLIVLDTPPTAHALDFLSAPERMLQFLDHSVLQWFLKPYMTLSRLGMKTFKMTSTAALKVAERLTGAEVIRDILDFFESFEGMYEGFRQRAETVDKILRRDRTGFILVATPSRATLEEALKFYRRLKKMGMPLAAVIINRATVVPDGFSCDLLENEDALERAKQAAPLRGDKARIIIRRMWENARAVQTLMKQEQEEIASFREIIGDEAPLFVVPRFDEDIHDIEGLQRFAESLFRNDP